MSDAIYTDFHTPMNRPVKTTTTKIYSGVFGDREYDVWCVSGAGYEFYATSGEKRTSPCLSPDRAEMKIKELISREVAADPNWQAVILINFHTMNSMQFSVERVWTFYNDAPGFKPGWAYVGWDAEKDPWTSQSLPGEPGSVGPMYAVYPHSEELYQALWTIKHCYNVLRDRMNAGLTAKNPTTSLELFAERLHAWLVTMGYMEAGTR